MNIWKSNSQKPIWFSCSKIERNVQLHICLAGTRWSYARLRLNSELKSKINANTLKQYLIPNNRFYFNWDLRRNSRFQDHELLQKIVLTAALKEYLSLNESVTGLWKARVQILLQKIFNQQKLKKKRLSGVFFQQFYIKNFKSTKVSFFVELKV